MRRSTPLIPLVLTVLALALGMGAPAQAATRSSGPSATSHRGTHRHRANRHRCPRRGHGASARRRCRGHLSADRRSVRSGNARRFANGAQGTTSGGVPKTVPALPATSAVVPTSANGVGLGAGSTGDCSAADQQPSALSVAAAESATLCLINQQRADHGLRALRLDSTLQAVAVAHSSDMVVRDYFDHTTLSGETATQRVLASGYVPRGSGYTIGENIAYGTGILATPRSIVTAWMNSPEHRANILDPDYRQTGLGVAPAVPASFSHGQPGGIYTQEFGVID